MWTSHFSKVIKGVSKMRNLATCSKTKTSLLGLGFLYQLILYILTVVIFKNTLYFLM